MTPAELKATHLKNDTGKVSDYSRANKMEDNREYRELIGSLMYLAVAIRPHISNTVSKLAQIVNDPQTPDIKATKRILRYLTGTRTFGVKYTRSIEKLLGYLDADWGGCTRDRRSCTGYTFLLANGEQLYRSRRSKELWHCHQPRQNTSVYLKQ